MARPMMMETQVDILVATKKGSADDSPSDPSAVTAQDSEPEKSERAGCTARDMYQDEARKLIDGINQKRERDNEVVADYKKAMESQVDKMCNMMKQNLFQIYEAKGKEVKEKLQELYDTLDRITQLEEELNEFRQALGMLYQEVHN